ncbi:MAG: FAD-binding oxidoreductase [Caldimicrobium sp.]
MSLPKETVFALKKILKDRLLTEDEDLEAYSYDSSPLFFKPSAVALPETKEEVLKILELADKYEFYVVSRGSGTSTTGSALPILGGLVISFTRMNRILELNHDERIVRVQPGVLNGELKRYLKKFGLFYPPDPASYAFSTIGGNVATGAGGPRGLKYGTTKDYVLAMEVALPGGKLLKTGPHTLKGVVPYNFTQLFVGSEGTLGIFVEIVLKLLPLPKKRCLYLIFFTSEDLAIDVLNELLLEGLTPAAAEFVDKTSLKVCEEALEPLKAEAGLSNRIESLLFLEIDGKVAEVLEDSQFIESFLKTKKISFVKREKEEEIEKLWEIRRNISPLLKKLRSKKISDDIVVPRKKMKEFLGFVRGLEKNYGLYISAFGHLGDGNFHVNILFENEEKALEVREAILRKVIELTGTISGEHGIGYLKRSYVSWELDPLQIEFMKKLKKVFDPKGLLNPQIKLP